MAGRTGAGAVDQGPGTHLGRSPQEEAECPGEVALIGRTVAIQARLTQAGIHEGDDHRLVVAQARHELAHEQDLERLADVVPVNVKGGLLVQHRVDVGCVEGGQFRHVVDFGGDDLEMWTRVGELPRRFSQLGQERQCKDKGVDDVDLDDLLEPFGNFVLCIHDTGIFDHGVESGKGLCPFGESERRCCALQIQGPHLDGFGSVGAVPDTPHNVFFGSFTFLDRSDGQDQFGGIEAVDVASRFESEADVGATDDDSLASEGLGGICRCSKKL